MSDTDWMIGRRRLQDVSDLHETVVVLVDNGKALPVHGRDQIDERLQTIVTDVLSLTDNR